jgi:hypothetical protein
MSREITDTNDNYPDRDIPDGTYIFKVASVAKRYGGSNKDRPFYSWKLEYEGVKGDQVLMPNKMGDLLRVLKCTETKPGSFDWDTDLVVNQEFEATVFHQTDKKGVLRQEMSDFKAVKEEAPF